MKQHPADVSVAIPGKTASPSLDRVHRFQPAGEAEVLDALHDRAHVFSEPIHILVEADDVAGVLRKLNIAGSGHSHGLLGVFGHHLGVEVDGPALASEYLIFESANPRTPLPPILVKNTAGFFGIEKDCPRTPAVFHRE